ncbi:NERD domain-containing protein [Pseudidiomarina sp. PP-1MA]|uniref:NERD domain-containing protein n=1 Tax=Pseudidiomarina sp. PP-1MA TaxID=3237706 RepID=A0AB39X9E4_9GAMM
MRMIPSTPLFGPNGNRPPKSEVRIFNKLRECFIERNDFVCFHSLNLTRHEYKRFGEADFVILSPYGLYVVEVKGGGISVSEGRWTSENNEGVHNISDPFKQAHGALQAIYNKLKDMGQIKPVANYKYTIAMGYGVIFPDSFWSVKGAEWERAQICDRSDTKNIENWLKGLMGFWRKKDFNDRVFSSDEIKAIERFLRPSVEYVESLGQKLERLEESRVGLTEQQYQILDFAEYNPRGLFFGGAGTGKTFLAAELSRRSSALGKSVALVCKSPFLRSYLKNLLDDFTVQVYAIESFRREREFAGKSKFDVIILDEGQDLFNLEDILEIEDALEGGFKHGSWFAFHDAKNQSGLVGNTTAEGLSYLEEFSPIKLPLTTNCRNTKQILSMVQDKLGVDMGNIGTGEGSSVREQVANSQDEACHLLNAEISFLVENGIPTHNITLLSPLPWHESIAANLCDAFGLQIQRVDSYSIESFPPAELSFCEVANFKGLENSVIILIDVEKAALEESGVRKASLYVGMSRARDILSVIWRGY